MLYISDPGNKYPQTGGHGNWNWVTTSTEVLPVSVHRKICSSGYERIPVKRKNAHWIIYRNSVRLWNLWDCLYSLNHSGNLCTLSMDMEGSLMIGQASWDGQTSRSVWESTQFMYIKKHPVILTNLYIFFTFNLCSWYTVVMYIVHLGYCVLFRRFFFVSYWKCIKSEGCR
jgi:hypothetical protein